MKYLIMMCGVAACHDPNGKWNPKDMPAQVKEATQAINEVFGDEMISFDNADNGIEVNIFNVPYLEHKEGDDHDEAWGMTYYFHKDRYQISLSNEIVWDTSIWVIFHELGHAMGLEHDASPTDIMYPYARPAFMYDNDIAKQLKKHCDDIGGCKKLFIKSINVR